MRGDARGWGVRGKMERSKWPERDDVVERECERREEGERKRQKK